MIDLNFLHPYPRYGVAAALVEQEEISFDDLTTWERVAELAWKAIDRALLHYTLYTTNDPAQETTKFLEFDYLDEKILDPGKKSGQTAANGYYLSPYIITTDGSSAATVAEARAIRDLLKTATQDDLQKTLKLKRSFAPLTSKINNGRSSMAEPKATLLEAAFTVVATLTECKPAAQVAAGKGMANTTIIPDLPLIEDEYTPLIDFVQLFFDMRVKKGDAFRVIVEPKDRKFKRPPLFRGNYPNAPRDGSLGAISLVVAIGAWAREGGTFKHKLNDGTFQNESRWEYARQILTYLQERPLYVLSYEEVRQESYGHHLVGMAIEQDLASIVRAAHRSFPFGIEKPDDPKYKLYKRFFERFLLQFDHPSFRDFMAARNEYSFELEPIFNLFMQDQYQLSTELIASARAYGQSLNSAAYITARAEQQEDIKNKRRERQLSEYKNRILVQFESTILSAKTPTALLSQMGIIIGRLTGREMDSEATLFMETAAGWPIEKLSLAQELITAFMRLSSYRPKSDLSSGASDSNAETVETVDNPANDEMPN
ncbi:hypothetical protein [Spirosoma panaciterrae]|uniref:hypothetical protein n=1 Tax=Spirosoma panaciterrae TaxID=496058 RepID=UPI000381AFB7|nr:hypothetical protein [Spirosoma panaciterrae]